jgi:hypothetical protein
MTVPNMLRWSLDRPISRDQSEAVNGGPIGPDRAPEQITGHVLPYRHRDRSNSDQLSMVRGLEGSTNVPWNCIHRTGERNARGRRFRNPRSSARNHGYLGGLSAKREGTAVVRPLAARTMVRVWPTSNALGPAERRERPAI